MRGIFLNDCRTRNATSFRSKEFGGGFPDTAEQLVRLDFVSLDALLRLSMCPPDKVVTAQYKAYRNFSECFRKLYCWISFEGKPD